MNITGRKHSNSLVEEEDDSLPPMKKVKDSDFSETSSEDTPSCADPNLLKMAGALKTILEVGSLFPSFLSIH
jgi:hypothetical protein